jgi:hypothetical protein
MRRSEAHLVFACAFLLAPALSARAQQLPSSSFGPISAITAEWLQLNGGEMYRDGSPSTAWGIAHDFRTGLRFELGYLRVARNESSAKGATAGVSFPLSYRRVTVRPGVTLLAGTAQASRDSGGYYYTTPSGQPGYQPRMRYTRGTTVGALASLVAELRLTAGISATASIRQAGFSGDVLYDDRYRTLAGFGLSVRPGSLLQALHLRGASTNTPATTGNQQ